MVSLFEKAWHLLKDDIEIAPRDRLYDYVKTTTHPLRIPPPMPTRRDYQRHAEKLRQRHVEKLRAKKEKRDE